MEAGHSSATLGQSHTAGCKKLRRLSLGNTAYQLQWKM